MMKLPKQHLRAASCSIALLTACIVGTFSAHTEESQLPRDKKQIVQAPEKGSEAADTNQVVVPQSQFVVPVSSKEGRDPFFPNLINREAAATPVATEQQPAKSRAEDLALQGISGHADRMLCVISGRTLAVGNEADIVLPGGTLRVRCLEINETFVVIELGGERLELHFKPQKR